MDLYGGGGGGQAAGDDNTMMLVMGGLCFLFLCSLIAGGFYMYSSKPTPEPIEPAETLPEPAGPLLPNSPGVGDPDPDPEVTTSPATTTKPPKKLTGSCASFAVTHDFNVKGKVLKSKTQNSWQDCCKWCYNTGGCNAWSFEKNTKICTLKNKDGYTQTNIVNTGYISGAVGGTFSNTGSGKNSVVYNPLKKPPSGKTCTGTPIQLSWYSWQNNSPCNSSLSSSGKPLVPYKHVAIPSKLAKTYPLGTKLFVDGLKGKSTGRDTHSGWVEVADLCAEGGVSSCYTSGGKPLVRLYIGDYTKAKASCASTGPSRAPAITINKGTSKAWNLPLEAAISCKTTPSYGERAFNGNYGGAPKGIGKCGECASTKAQLGKCYFDGVGNKKYCS